MGISGSRNAVEWKSNRNFNHRLSLPDEQNTKMKKYKPVVCPIEFEEAIWWLSRLWWKGFVVEES